MTLGSPSLAQWGTPAWGDVDFDPSIVVKLESLARGELQRTLLFDSIAELLDAELSLGFDSLGQGTSDLAVAFDVAQGRVPTAEFLADCTANVLLIEMRLPAGTRRFATIPLNFAGLFYEGRQVSVTTIQRTQGSGTDDVQIKLDDTDEGGQDRLRDLFLANPPEGSGVTIWVILLDDLAKNRYQLFEGIVERVAGFSRSVVSIDVLRNEAVEDVELGRPITLDDFPNAPDDSLSSQRPIVYGEVEAHEGVAVDVNALGKLAERMTAPPPPFITPGHLNPAAVLFAFNNATGTPQVQVSDTIRLEDASEFPPAGSVLIGDEEIAYTGKNGDELTGLTRGSNGTLMGEHSRSSEVKEVGDFTLLFADHPLSKLETIRVLGSDGVLGETVPDPSLIDFANGLVTWPETPKVRNPNAAPEYQRVHFKDIDPLNSAAGAQFSARENAGYRAFGVAQLGQAAGGGTMVLRTNTEGLGVPGDLLRVWVAVIFDPATLGITNGNTPLVTAPNGSTSPNQAWNSALPSSQLASTPGAAAVVVVGKSFNLQPHDLVPDEVARNDEKTGDRIYDVPDPVMAPQIGDTGVRVLSPDETIDPGVWQRKSLASRMIDGDPDTEAASFFSGFGEASFIGRGDAIFRLNTPPDLGSFEPVSGTLVFIAGWGPPYTPITSPMVVTVKDRTTGKIVAELQAQKTNNGIGTGLILNIQRFEAPIDIGLLDSDLGNVPDWDWIVSPVLGVSSGLWVGRELFIELDVKDNPPINSATIDVKGTVTNYFEVTDLVGISKTRDAKADWAFFSDLARGGRAAWRANIPNIDPQIVETFWVAEYTPFLDASSKVPRGFADVRGLVGAGGADTPADIAEQVITRATPLGMGLPASRLNRANYNPTKASQLADGIRMGFALGKPTSAVKLLEAITEQGDCRQNWDRGNHSLIRRPEPDVVLPVFRELTELQDILRDSLKLGRTGLGEARTRITGLYRVFAPSGKTSRSVELVDAAAELSFGIKGETATLDLIRDDVAAEAVMQRLLDRRRAPRWSVEIDMALPGLELRFGDLVSIQHKDIPGGLFEVCEVVGLNLEPGSGFDKVRVTCVVWKE